MAALKKTRPDSEAVWYFAYGSNIQAKRMTTRGITPLECRPVVVPDYTLTFDIFGIPYSEPSFASIAPIAEVSKQSYFVLRAGPDTAMDVMPVHGAAYLLSFRDYHRLVVSEGSGIGYSEVEVRASFLDSISKHDPDTTVLAKTLVAKYPWRPNRAPSKRYLDIMLSGARECNLPEEYLEFLTKFPSYEAEQGHVAQIIAGSFLLFWRPIIRQLARLTKLSVNEQGHCAPWLGVVIVCTYRAMWFLHDYVWCLAGYRGDGITTKHFISTSARVDCELHVAFRMRP